MIPNETRCPHFGSCGGCENQHVPYEEQLKLKQSFLNTLFASFTTDTIPIIPSPVIWQYRNKIDPSFSGKWYAEPPPKDYPRETVLGFKEKGNWRRPLEIESCMIGPSGTNDLFTSVKDWLGKCGLPVYNSRNGKGYLRHLLIRDGKRTGERMVVLITAPGALPDSGSFVSAVQSSFSASSIQHGEFSGRAEVAFAEKQTLLYGEEYICEKLHVLPPDRLYDSCFTETPFEYFQKEDSKHPILTFQISPMSFFQTNPLAAERLYAYVRSWSMTFSSDTLYDLYGGMGTIAMNVHPHHSRIISVEEVPSASEDGKINTSINNICNIEFVTASVQDYLRTCLENGGLDKNGIVVADPPRSGMHPKAIKRLMELRPERILYISCNPKRLREELEIFTSIYESESFQAFDLFPHTHHVELAVSLKVR